MNFTESNFQKEVLESAEPVLVDFWGPWCRPCHALAPTIDKLAAEASGYKVGKVNIDENPELVSEFGISAIPTVLLIKDGKVVNRWVGLVGEDKLRRGLDQVIN
jgi:thioredoxin 1